MDLFQPSCRAIARRAAFLRKKAASKRRVGVRKHRFWLTVLAPDALKKLGNPSGLPSFFHTPIIQNRRVVPLSRKTMRGISLRETGLPAVPPRCGVPCSHPANFICRGPAHKRRTGQFAQRPHWGLCRLRRPQNCEAPLERQFLMQSEENRRRHPLWLSRRFDEAMRENCPSRGDGFLRQHA